MRSNVGPYRIESMLGRGGMGVVYRAVHEHLGRPVAIKALAPELTQQPEFRDRFFAEAKTQARLQHPNIVGIYDLLADGGEYFIVMEFVSGEVLDDRLAASQNVGLELGVACEIFSQMLAALDYAHSEGVIHRDIKPSNVLITESGRIKLTDFGIALLIGDKRLTASHSAIGTPTYMSPEQIARPRAVDHRTDIYSAAVVFFEMLVGKPPFEEDTEYGIKKLHVETPPPDLLLLRPTLSPELVRVVAKALAKDPEERHASAGLFLRELQAALPQARPGRTLPSPTRVAPTFPGEPSPAAAAPPTLPPPLPPNIASTRPTLAPPLPIVPPLPAAPRGRWPSLAISSRLRPILLAAGALLVVALSFGLAVRAFQGGKTPEKQDLQDVPTAQMEEVAIAPPPTAVDEQETAEGAPEEGAPEIDEPVPSSPPVKPTETSSSPQKAERANERQATPKARAPAQPSRALTQESSEPAEEEEEEESLSANTESVSMRPPSSRQDEPSRGVEAFSRMKELIDNIQSLSNKAVKAQESENGDEAAAERLEAFHDNAEEVKDAFRAATGTGVKANLKKIFKRGESNNEAAMADLRIKIAELVRKADAIDQRVDLLRPGAKAYWYKLRRYLTELEAIA